MLTEEWERREQLEKIQVNKFIFRKFVSMEQHVAHPFVFKKFGFMLSQNLVVAKDVKSCTYCYYVICTTLTIRVGGIPWPQTGATHYHAQLVLPDKVRAIKRLFVFYAVWLGSMKGMGLRICAICAGLVLVVVVRMAIELKYPNTPIET